jgi:hypothetical protein
MIFAWLWGGCTNWYEAAFMIITLFPEPSVSLAQWPKSVSPILHLVLWSSYYVTITSSWFIMWCPHVLTLDQSLFFIFLIGIVGGVVQLGPLCTAATNRPIVPAPGDYDDGEIGGMIGRGNWSSRRKPVPVPLCPPQTPHAVRTRTRATTVRSQWLTTWAMARPLDQFFPMAF